VHGDPLSCHQHHHHPFLNSIRWSNGQEVASYALPAAWWLDLCPAIIDTMPRATLNSAFNIPSAGCVGIGAINLIPDGTGVLPLSIIHFVPGFVQQLPHI
jgi:hypothetical protein